ncbi:MAG: mobile mystery protein A [Planctomycetota bacterium]|jgi:predicted DNA-binding mobile mystery protein A
MRTERIKLVRRQLDAKLECFRPLKDIKPPRKGWIRAIRDALGMTGEQLAKRIGTNKQRVARIESDESQGRVTIKTLRHVAEGLDCVFVYGFVPRTTLEETVRSRAMRVASKRMGKVSRTMELEQQGLDDREQEIVLQDAAKQLVDTSLKTIWNDD